MAPRALRRVNSAIHDSGTSLSLTLRAGVAQTAKISDVGLSRVMQATMATVTTSHVGRGCALHMLTSVHTTSGHKSDTPRITAFRFPPAPSALQIAGVSLAFWHSCQAAGPMYCFHAVSTSTWVGICALGIGRGLP